MFDKKRILGKLAAYFLKLGLIFVILAFLGKYIGLFAYTGPGRLIFYRTYYLFVIIIFLIVSLVKSLKAYGENLKALRELFLQNQKKMEAFYRKYIVGIYLFIFLAFLLLTYIFGLIDNNFTFGIKRVRPISILSVYRLLAFSIFALSLANRKKFKSLADFFPKGLAFLALILISLLLSKIFRELPFMIYTKPLSLVRMEDIFGPAIFLTYLDENFAPLGVNILAIFVLSFFLSLSLALNLNSLERKA